MLILCVQSIPCSCANTWQCQTKFVFCICAPRRFLVSENSANVLCGSFGPHYASNPFTQFSSLYPLLPSWLISNPCPLGAASTPSSTAIVKHLFTLESSKMSREVGRLSATGEYNRTNTRTPGASGKGRWPVLETFALYTLTPFLGIVIQSVGSSVNSRWKQTS